MSAVVATYRKKPVEIQAVQYTGENAYDIVNFMGTAKYDMETRDIIISTLEGAMRASKGDFIIRGVKGEFYPCKPDIFEATYERVTNDA